MRTREEIRAKYYKDCSIKEGWLVTTDEEYLLEEIFEAQNQAKGNEVLDLVSNSDTAKKYYGLISKCEEVIFNDDEEDQTGKIADIVYEHLNIGS